MKTKPITNLIIKKSLRDSIDGTEGKCFIDKDKVFKLYKQVKPINKVMDFSQYKSDSIAFPLHYLKDFKDNFIAGEVMKYFNKPSLYVSLKNDKTNIDKLVSNFCKLMIEIREYPEIFMNDMFSGNILYDENGFVLIDTSSWVIHQNKNFSQTNISIIANEIMEIIVEIYMELNDYILEQNKRKFTRYGEIGEELYNVLSMTSYDSDSLLEILELYRELVFRVLGVKVETLEDIYNNKRVFKK